MDRSHASRAIVIGGSIGGLVAAGVLAARFAQVQVLERDTLADGPTARKGVPQARHVHVLLKRGEAAIERFFPGIFDELLALGAERVDTAGDARWHYRGEWKLRFPSGIEMVSQTRDLLEWTLRRRLAALGNVAFVEGDACGLEVAGGRVRGVSRRDDGVLEADLVVDATGRGSRLPQWLERAGFAAPPESEVFVDVGYASRLYRRTGAPRDWTALLCHPRFPDPRCGVLLPVEGDRWLLTLVGWFGEHPPGDESGFRRFVENLATPEIAHAVKDAEPVSPIAVHRLVSNRRRHYERVPLPEGLVVTGDAVASFNPVYAQGMASAALGAELLAACLDEAPTPLADGVGRRHQARLARFLDGPWLLATSEDLRSAEARGPRPPWLGLLHWYTARVHALTWRDRFAAQRFLEVMHLLRPPSALFHPRILLRAVAG